LRKEQKGTKQIQLNQLIASLKSKLDNNSQETLDDLLEAHQEVSQTASSFAQKHLDKYKAKLLKNQELTEEELNKLCQLQAEVIKLEKSAAELEAKIEVPAEL
jgi:hypothetical protein